MTYVDGMAYICGMSFYSMLWHDFRCRITYAVEGFIVWLMLLHDLSCLWHDLSCGIHYFNIVDGINPVWLKTTYFVKKTSYFCML